MKIPAPEQIREADAFTIENEPISSVQLMERAAVRAFDKMLVALQLLQHVGNATASKIPFYVFCGPGNNGGDGLVMARYLHAAGFQVNVFLIRPDDQAGSADFLTNLDRLRNEKIKLSELNSTDKFPVIPVEGFIIDAIFGIGINRPLDGIYLETVRLINALPNKVISVDIPSGLMAEDNSINNYSGIIKAYLTLTFQFPKLAFLFPENADHIGKWEIIDIGIAPEFIDRLSCKRIYLSPEFVAHQLRKRRPFDHKGTYGHALIIAGSKGKGGAALLASKAVLRSGAGLLTSHVPARHETMMQIAFPEAMVSVDREADYVSSLPGLSCYSAAGAGPGIGTEKDTAAMLKKLIQDAGFPLVLDADAINILSENKTWLSFLPPGTVLTPHPGEFDRLFGSSDCGYERLQKQVNASFRFGISIVLKGAHTSISCPDGTIYFNYTGNPGMATAGTGDALTGIITGLLARGYSPETACVIGVAVHGRAGDIAAQSSSMESMIATDLIDHLGAAFREMDVIRD